MPSIKVKCACCGQMQFCQSAWKGSRGMAQIAENLSAQGWSGDVLSGRAVCSEECRASMARDVTPATRQICGIPIKTDASLPTDVVEFRHPDGRVDRFKV